MVFYNIFENSKQILNNYIIEKEKGDEHAW